MSNSQYLTVKELADILGVSKQSIYKQLSTKLSTYSTIVENVKMVDIRALKEVYGIDGFNQVEQPFQPSCQSVSTVPDGSAAEVESLNQVIEILREQLSTKDKQISDLQSKVDTTMALLDKEMQSNERLQTLLDHQQQLTLLASPPEDTNGDIDGVSGAEPEPIRRSIWSRIFRW